MKNLLLIFMMLFAVDSIAQLDQREKGDVVSPALNKNPNLIQKTGWTIEAIDPINDTLCSVTPSSDNLTILTASDCNARVYQDINSADIRKARFDKETMTVLLKLQSLTYVKITLNVYKKAATTETLTLLRTRSLENNSNVPLLNKKITFDVVTEDLNFVPNANLADSLRIEFTFEPTVVFPAGVAKVEVNDFRVFSSPMNYSPLLHEVREESGWTAWQPITITAQTTNPTKGTTTTDACRKRRDGTQLKIDFEYRQGSAGTAGNGVYFFSCGGLTLNGENLTPDYDLVNNVNIGSGDGTSGTFGVVLNTSGQILLSNSAGTISSTNVSMSQSGLIYRFNASIAIKEWRQSSLSATQLSDASNAESWGDFVFFVNSNGSIVNNNSQGVVGTSASISDTSTYSIVLSGLTSPPICIPGTRNPSNVSATTISASASSLVVRTYDTQSNAPIASSMEVVCFKAGNDRLKAFKQYISGQFKESNIEKDVEQFHTDERKICDRCWKGGALYKKCFDNTQINNNFVLANGATGLAKNNLYQRWNSGTMANRFISYPYFFAPELYNVFTFSSGNLINQCVGVGCTTTYLYGCIEYSKD